MLDCCGLREDIKKIKEIRDKLYGIFFKKFGADGYRHPITAATVLVDSLIRAIETSIEKENLCDSTSREVDN